MKTPIYDQNWAENYDALAEAGIAGRAGLYRLCAASLADLGAAAQILIVGAGIGTELLELAARFPAWQFTAVEPATAMLDVARGRVENAGLQARVHFVAGFVSAVPNDAVFDGATAILVSQHIVDPAKRRDFYREIGARLKPNAPLYHAETCGDTRPIDWKRRLKIWEQQAIFAGCPPETAREMVARLGDETDAEIRVVPAQTIVDLLQDAGFSRPLCLFRSMHFHAFLSNRVGCFDADFYANIPR